MIQSLFPGVKALIIDMDGVLWKAEHPLGDLPAIFNRIQQMGLKDHFLPPTTPHVLLKNMWKGFINSALKLTPDQIVTSSIATAHLMKKRYPDGGPVFVVGETGLVETLKSHGFYQQEANVLAVVAGMDTTATYAKLSQATLLIHAGAAFYATNPDSTFPTPNGPAMGAGGLIAAIETSSGVKPIIAGKPNSPMMSLVLEKLSLAPEEIYGGWRPVKYRHSSRKEHRLQKLPSSSLVSVLAKKPRHWIPHQISITADFTTLIG